MNSSSRYYLVAAEVLPEIFLKVAEANRLLKAGEVPTAGDAAKAVGIKSTTEHPVAALELACFLASYEGQKAHYEKRGYVPCQKDLIAEVAQVFNTHGIQTEIIAASIRHPMHVTECALAGADIATVPFKVIEQMCKHPLTDQGIEKFKKDYEAVFGK